MIDWAMRAIHRDLRDIEIKQAKVAIATEQKLAAADRYKVSRAAILAAITANPRITDAELDAIGKTAIKNAGL